MHRRRFIAGLAASSLGLSMARASTDQGAPAAESAGVPLTILLPVPDGGGLGRLGHRLADCLGNTEVASLVTEGQPSAPHAITRFIDDFSRRGDVVLLAGASLIGAAIAVRQATSLADLTPVARLTTEYIGCAVRPDSPFATLADLVAAMRETPDRVSFCGGSRGSFDYILAAMINRHAGLPARQLRYRSFIGGVGTIDAVLAGTQSCACGGVGELQDHLAAGRIRLLGLAAPQRLPGLPAATLIEQGLDISLANWRGVFAPPGIAGPALDRLIARMDATVGGGDWRATLYRYNWTGDYLAGEAFGAFVREDTQRLRALLSQFGL
ncbi:hypothetical protein MWN33_00780 [Starkeya koreensis]|uniref:Tricarboxylic transport membrane protein n=1 Tax=Ancylobacter koreensis TaxID=266121 RepID=A0ABT0DH19_9HYPH|nr:tripartite tricarboxylate transporter substrate-binding protein [Ancylobacter koreensis]MCK0206565.1 hypothetical protein [Ancylobacter koreensis]